ncbi:MAG TPA: hypothetical protein VNU01_11550 [Egibacteraceae bacterium]|nr:hypothetical protein [Egibacteraceae bacterium]
MRRAAWLVAVLALALGACGEPEVPLQVPPRGADDVVIDDARILDVDALARDLYAFRHQGWDPVLVTFEAEGASMGMADRAGRKVIEAWGADLAIVAVAEPGDFRATGSERRRFFGLFARDVREVPRDVRERIVEELVPPIAARNDWTEAFHVAVTELAGALGEVDEDIR